MNPMQKTRKRVQQSRLNHHDKQNEMYMNRSVSTEPLDAASHTYVRIPNPQTQQSLLPQPPRDNPFETIPADSQLWPVSATAARIFQTVIPFQGRETPWIPIASRKNEDAAAFMPARVHDYDTAAHFGQLRPRIFSS
jgi:hypothetical protein